MLKLAFLASYLYTFAYDIVNSNKRSSKAVLRSLSYRNRPPIFQTSGIGRLPDDPFELVLAFDPIIDDYTNFRERILRITNGLRPWDADYEGVVLCTNLISRGHLLIGTLECTDGVTFDISSKHQKPKPPINAYVVHRDGGVWAESDGKGLSPFVAPNLQAIIMQTITDTFHNEGRAVNWGDDVFEDTNEL